MTYLFSSNTAITNEVEVKNDVGNALPVVGVTGAPLTVSFSETNYDAFGRFRTSTPHTLYDSTLRYGDDTRDWDTSNTAGNSTVVHNINTSTMEMRVTTAAGAKVVRQTKRYFQYQPGKSLLSLNTGVMNTPKANLRQRIGYFDVSNGIYFENNGTDTYIVKRSNSTGIVTETRVPQSQWSDDKLDGTGLSGKTMNIAAGQIFWTDVEWLGLGSVRAGVIIDGEYVLAHKFHHANTVTDAYMTSASLPIRYEIENTGITSSSSVLKHICNSIISEGGYTPRVITRAVSTPLSGLEMSQEVYRPLISIRLKANRPGGIVVPAGTNLYGLQTTPFSYRVINDANVIGGTWVSPSDESHIEYNITATGLGVGGRNLLQGMFNGGTYTTPIMVNFKDFNGSYQLRTKIDGTNEVFTIAVIATTNNDDALGTLIWEEFN